MQDEGLAGDLLAEPPGKRRAAALHGVGAQRAADQADEAGGDGRVEDDRAGCARRACRRRSSPPPARPPSRPIASGSSPAGPRARPKPSPVSRPVLALGQRLQVGVAAGCLVLAGDAGRGGDRDPLGALDVDRLLDPDDPRVGLQRGPLDRERQLGDPRGRPLAPARGRCSPASAGRLAGRSAAARRTRPRRRPAAASAARAAIAATPVRREVGAEAVADPAADPGPDADPALGRRGEALDLAAVDAHLAPRVLGA